MIEDDFHDFDPYDTLLQISALLNELTFQHNQLVDDYTKTCKRLKMVEKQLIDIQMKMIEND